MQKCESGYSLLCPLARQVDVVKLHSLCLFLHWFSLGNKTRRGVVEPREMRWDSGFEDETVIV